MSTPINPHTSSGILTMILVRILIALSVIATAPKWPLFTGAGLVLCVWVDAVSGLWARRAQWKKTEADIEWELLGDFICFIWAPVAWILAREADVFVRLACGGFVMAGAYRLVRFKMEGLVNGGYRGLPVTYNGYAVPAIGALVSWLLPFPQIVWPLALLGLSAAMASRRLIIPEL